jgi:hypothetical protein
MQLFLMQNTNMTATPKFSLAFTLMLIADEVLEPVG